MRMIRFGDVVLDVDRIIGFNLIDGLEAAVVVALVDGVPDGSLIVERFPVGVRWTITTIDEHKAARDVAVADARAYLAQLARELTDAHQPPADALDA